MAQRPCLPALRQGTNRIGRLNGKTTRPGLRKCYACKKPFTVRIGTIFEDSHLPLHLWLQIIHLMCCQQEGHRHPPNPTDAQLQHENRVVPRAPHPRSHEGNRGLFTAPLGGAGKTVEADETLSAGRPESRVLPGPAPKQAVMALVERGGKVRSLPCPERHAPTRCAPSLARHAHRHSRFMTDEVARPIPASAGTSPRTAPSTTARRNTCAATSHTNTVEGFFSILKRGIYGVYQHVTEAHLHRYLCEFDFRYSNRIKLGVDDMMRADSPCRASRASGSPIKQLVANGLRTKPRLARQWRRKRR